MAGGGGGGKIAIMCAKSTVLFIVSRLKMEECAIIFYNCQYY